MATYHFSVRSGKRGQAAKHATYILRQGRYSNNREFQDLVITGFGNFPKWSNNPIYFWEKADKNERINGAVYREFEVALPTELSLDQNLELLRGFIRAEIGEKTYQFAIHEPKAALGGVPQPHAHIMFSDRMLDTIERSPEQHFKRYNPFHPEIGGCKKDSGGKDRVRMRNEITHTRKQWAVHQNAMFEKHGIAARVDHRSHVDRGIERSPGKHLGAIQIREMTPDQKAAYQSMALPAERD